MSVHLAWTMKGWVCSLLANRPWQMLGLAHLPASSTVEQTVAKGTRGVESITGEGARRSTKEPRCSQCIYLLYSQNARKTSGGVTMRGASAHKLHAWLTCPSSVYTQN